MAGVLSEKEGAEPRVEGAGSVSLPQGQRESMGRAGRLSREDAESSAERLRPYIRREVYQDLVQRLEDIL